MKSESERLLGEIRDLKSAVIARIKRRERGSLLKSLRLPALRLPRARPGPAPRCPELSAWQSLRDASPSTLVTVPVIYGFFFVAVILDLGVSLAQAALFPFYEISKVKRGDYIAFDRHRLPYLNWIEQLNCDYCGYVNGVIAYAREVASRVEQYFCPIRHALQLLGLHPRFDRFLPYGEALDFHAKLARFRAELRRAGA